MRLKWLLRIFRYPVRAVDPCFAISSESRVSFHWDGIVLMNVNSGALYKGNPAAREILTWVMNRHRESEIAARLADTYTIPLEQARADTAAFMAQLRACGFLTVREEAGRP
jgi:hypothetical protein